LLRRARRPSRDNRRRPDRRRVFGHSQDIVGLVTIIVLVGLGQVLSLEVEENG